MKSVLTIETLSNYPLRPPPPAEPYEDFLARVGRDLSDSSRSATQLTAAARPCALVTTTTTGNRLPTPFPTYEVSSWTLQKQVQASRIRMPLPAYYYAALPSPWVWPRWGSAVTNSVVRAFQFFGCHAPFCPADREPCTTVRPSSRLCGSHGDTTRCCEHFTGPFPRHDQELEGLHA